MNTGYYMLRKSPDRQNQSNGGIEKLLHNILKATSNETTY